MLYSIHKRDITLQGLMPSPEKKRSNLRRGIIRCPRKETGSMDGLSPAKQNGGQAQSGLTRRLVFLIAHFISVLTLTGCDYPERTKTTLHFCVCKK